MNRNQAKELSPIIKAFGEGKIIEQKCAESWVEVDEDCDFHFPANTYRIKPEPKYRPFKGAEECWEEMQKHQPFGWIKPKDVTVINRFMLIDSLRNEGVTVRTDVRINYHELVGYYTFADCTPFGILEEE